MRSNTAGFLQVKEDEHNDSPPMISFPESICPLCSQFFARDLLHEHIASEHADLRQRTIKVIQAYHPSWVEQHGACEPCWRSYRDAGRILNIMKRAKPQNDAAIEPPRPDINRSL
jgi:hypothetical protein